LTVRYFSLGGLGEVGMNCAVFEQDGQQVILDCGVSFPDDDILGIDKILPDFSLLLARPNNIVAVIITHGHMDHIGALPELMGLIDVPVFASRFAAALIKPQLAEAGFEDNEVDIRVVKAGDVTSIGPFTAEFIHTTHSIPDSLAVALRTNVGVIVHTADFKIDEAPFNEPPIDLARLTTLGDEGVRLLLSDSTNILRAGSTVSETAVRAGLEDVVRNASGRVFVTMFSTNLFRIQSLLETAAATGRRLLLLGRSLQRNVQIGRDLGLVKVAADVWISEDAATSVPDDQLIIACTGSQAQPRAALARMAYASLAGFELANGDTVVFSARSIPGNEAFIARLKDQIVRKGATVIDDGPVHCSGHACRDEQARMLEIVRPKSFVPVHGDHRYLIAHAALAAQLGVTNDSHVLENGEILEINEHRCRVVDTFKPRRVCVTGTPFGVVGGPAIRSRRRLAERGLAIVVLVVNSDTGELDQAAEIQNHGLFDPEFSGALMEDLLDVAEDAFYDLSSTARLNEHRATETVRVAVMRAFKKETGRKPFILALVIYV
jgi:ribonuclease J